MNNVYLDTETTDIIPGQILELTMIIEDAGTSKLIAAKNYFFEVKKIEPKAQEAHGFSVEDTKTLSNGEMFADRSVEIHEILKESCIIAHNEAFDERFLSSELWRCGVSFTPVSRVCTMEYFKPILKIPNKYPKYGPYKNPKLGEVISWLDINVDKVNEYSRKLFDYDGSVFHDSRFDTTAMYVAVNVYREKLHGGTEWHRTFCN